MSYQYNVAFSFASENRNLVEPIAMELHKKGVRVFYDLLEQDVLWGKDLYQHLADTYSTKSQYCIIFISSFYLEKEWTKHELRSAQARAFKQDVEYILPIRLDDTKLPGLPETIGYLDYRLLSIEKIIELILKKIGLNGINLDKKKSILFWKIRSVVNACDPIDLLSIGKRTPFNSPPSDEYDAEISEIYDLLPSVKSPYELAVKIRNVFVAYFSEGIAGDLNNYTKMAHELWILRDGESFNKLYEYEGHN